MAKSQPAGRKVAAWTEEDMAMVARPCAGEEEIGEGKRSETI